MCKKLSESDFKVAAAALNCELAVVKAVSRVESNGQGFTSFCNPVILFEGHKFHKYTKGAYTGLIGNEDISYKKWVRTYYNDDQYARLDKAMCLDREAALMSASWGKFQIMGFNYELAGFDSVEKFVSSMYKSELDHLLAFVSFVKKTGLASKLRNRDWRGFARGYNGSGYAKNSYDIKLADAYKEFST
jgi:hypothetical protein